MPIKMVSFCIFFINALLNLHARPVMKARRSIPVWDTNHFKFFPLQTVNSALHKYNLSFDLSLYVWQHSNF